MTTISTSSSDSLPRSEDMAAPTQPPGPWLAALRGGARGALIGAIIAMAFVGWDQRPTLNPLLDIGALALLGFLSIALFDGIFSLLKFILSTLLRLVKAQRPARWLAALPMNLFGQIVGAFLFIFGRALWPDSFFKSATIPAPGGMLIFALVLGGACIGLGRWLHPRRRTTAVVLYGIAVLPVLLTVGWLVWPGAANAGLPPVTPAPVPALALENPGQPGPYTVQHLTYGSGTDRLRPEYAEGATLITETVDGAPIYAGVGGLLGDLNTRLWGFDYTHLPLNAHVWYPEGAGPFPLVMIVHGNHTATEFSEAGYAYLGEHLASRGYIAVSVDENFLNGNMMGDGGGQEMPLRAWLLLKHLALWREWNADNANPFYGQVDLERVALIGHSRGGEAVALAADMNTRLYAPVNKVSSYHEFDFGIQAVVAIAPSDAMYRPRGDLLALRDISYLTLDGAHDADTDDFFGLAQYNRVTYSAQETDAFKAVAYLYRANHGQFNSVWDYGDTSTYNWLLLNRAVLYPEATQQSATSTLVTAFLEAVLNDRAGYRAVFYAPDSARDWLPEDTIVTQYQAATFLPIDTNQGLKRPEAVEVEGGSATNSDLTTWRAADLRLRNGNTLQGNTVLQVGWETGSTPTVSYDLPVQATAGWALTPTDALTFQITSADDNTPPGAVSVTLETLDGTRVTLDTATFIAPRPPLRSFQYKSPELAALFGLDLGWAWRAERVLQVVDLPLEAFLNVEPDLDLDAITGLHLAFEGSQAGTLYLDEVGFRRALAD